MKQIFVPYGTTHHQTLCYDRSSKLSCLRLHQLTIISWGDDVSIIVHLHARSIRIAVAVMFPGDLRQQPTSPVQKAEKMARNATMNSAITDLPMSANKSHKILVLINKNHYKNSNSLFDMKFMTKNKDCNSCFQAHNALNIKYLVDMDIANRKYLNQFNRCIEFKIFLT